tara:strand:- start:388 stop:810 length:423 start_codon:yes stop_codon:yes gene_type:complete
LKKYKRHIVKSFSWRIFGTLDTFILSYIITGNLSFGLSITTIDFFSKLFLYYFHERIWFKSNFKNHNTRHLIKTFTWRVIGSITTLLIAWILTGNPLTGVKIGIVETLTKMILYYIHEKVWYRLNYGLETRNLTYEKKNF